MKYGLKLKIFAAVIALAALFCLPALAEAAETTRYVATEQELLDAVAEANQMAADATGAGTTMDWMNIILTSDIEVNHSLEVLDDVRLRMTSAEGSKHRITSDGSQLEQYMLGYFFVWGGAQMEISNLIFDGCKNDIGFMVLLSAKATLTDVVLENFTTSGWMNGVIYSLKLNAATTPIHLVMNNCTVRNNTCIEYTRCITILYSDAITEVSGCTFTNNTTDSAVGGALGLAGTATITNSTFTGNSAIGGGALYGVNLNLTMSGCTFSGNQGYAPHSPDGGEGGGAMHMKANCTGTITNCDFISNTCDISGGAVTAFVNTTLTFTNCNFKNNVAATHGGAFCVADMFSSDDTKASRITLNNCLLDGNKANGLDQSGQHKSDPLAPGGGAIYLHEYCEATLNAGTVLQNNYAKDSGGAVYVSFGGRLTINSAKIENNESGLDGGGIYVDGASAYAGYSHGSQLIPMPDDGYATGGRVDLLQGRIYRNTAGRNGGGVYVGGENEVIVNGTAHIFTGGSLYMSGGVITENTALDMGGGVYVGACDTGEKGGILEMVDGAIYKNIAGENGNTSTGPQDAGADVYSEGGNAYITVVTADDITAYIRSKSNVFVPADHRNLYFTNWYDDYSDQDPVYGKDNGKIGTGTNTGRYMSSIDPDRMIYKPLNQDHAYNALILDYDTVKDAPLTGDAAPLALYMLMALASVAAMALLRRRRA